MNITLPTSWQVLTDSQLKTVFSAFSLDLSAPEVKALCFLKWGGIKVISQTAEGAYLAQKGKVKFNITASKLQALTSSLDFLDDIPNPPVRISKIGKYKAIPADFDGVPFEKFMILDNLFQGVLNSPLRDELLAQMTQILYDMPEHIAKKHLPTQKTNESISFLLTNTFYWFAGLKQYLAALYSNFFVPAADCETTSLMGSSLFNRLRDACNAQIRALTGGDITKEKTVLAMDTHRALTELDALARDADEYKKLNTK